jgi:hydrogenase-4 component F
MFESTQIMAMILILFLLTMIIWAFGKNIFSMLFLAPTDSVDKINVVINPWESFSQFTLLALAVYLGLNPPSGFVQLINDAVVLLPK